MHRNLLTYPAALLLAALVCPLTLMAPAPARADEGYGIESMTAKDWKDMWGFQKRGFAECWLAGKRHQAARTLAALERLRPQLKAGSPAAASVQAMHDELKTILGCKLSPKQLEESVDRFYEAPGNAQVLLGDALHHVVLELCACKPKAPGAPAG